MKKFLLLLPILLLLVVSAGWFFQDDILDIFKESPPAAFKPGEPPVYVSVGKMQIPVFDGGALAGQIVFEAILMVPDDRARVSIEPRLVVMRDLYLRDLNDVALLVGASGKPVSIEQIKTRLGRVSSRLLGADQPFELLIQNYSYQPA